MNPVSRMEGDSLPVSVFKDHADGQFELGAAAYEKRGIAVMVPRWDDTQCIGYPCEKEDVAASTALSWKWAKRCCDAHTRIDQALFAIVQGGMHLDLRLESVRRLLEIDAESRSSGGRGFQGFGGVALINLSSLAAGTGLALDGEGLIFLSALCGAIVTSSTLSLMAK